MRQSAGTLNRIWLTILGILVLAGGAALLLQATGGLHTLANTAPSGDTAVTGNLHTLFSLPWVMAIMLAGGLILGVVGVLWLIAQIPRKNTAGAYRLHEDGGRGFTLCAPSVLATAVETQIATLPGVVSSSALLRGTAKAPDLTLKVAVNDRTDIQDLIRSIQTTVLSDLSAALEAPLQRSRMQIEVSSKTQSTGTVVHSTGTVVQ